MRITSCLIACLLLVSLANAQIVVNPSVSHIIPDGAHTTGSITLSVSGSTSPYTYTWNPGVINTSSLTSISAGQYTVLVKSASSQTVSYAYSLGYKVSWTNLNQTTVGHDSLTSSLLTDGYATACSKNTLRPNTDGWMEFVIKSTGVGYYFGFLDSLSLSTGLNSDIDYGVYFTGAGTISAFESGTLTAFTNTPTVGDVIRIERSGDEINYKVNGITMRTVGADGLGQKNLKLKIAFIKNGSWIANVGCSFMHLDSTNFPNYVQLKPYVIHSSGTSVSDGNLSITPQVSGTYSYSWQPGTATTSSVNSLGIGSYSVTVTDASANQNTYTYNVGYKTGWTGLYNASLSHDTIKGTVVNDYASGYSKNVIPSGADGWFEYVVIAMGKNYYVGFLDSLYASPSTYSDIDYGYYFTPGVTGNNKDMYWLESSTIQLINIAPRAGDVMRVERIKDTIRYKINGLTLRSLTVTGISLKAWKIKLVAYNKGGIINVGMSRPPMEFSTIVTQDIACIPSQTTGSVSVTMGGGKAPITSYTWDATSTSTVGTKTSLTAGTHTVQAADADGYTTSQTYTVWQCPVWTTTTTPLTISTKGDITKTGGTNGWDDGYLMTNQLFRFKDTAAWISFDVADTVSSYMLGFRSVTGDSIAQPTNYKFYIENAMASLIETDNDGFYNKMQISKVNPGSHIKIQFTNNGIEYYRSTSASTAYELVYTSKLFSSTPLIIEGILNRTGSKVNNIRVSGSGN